MRDAFDPDNEVLSTRLISIHSQDVIDILDKLSSYPHHVRDYNPFITMGLDETNAVNNRIMRRCTKYPDIDNYEMIFSGPHFYVGNPLYKTPRSACLLNSDYDTIDLTSISDVYFARTNYVPVQSLTEYRALINGLDSSTTWIDTYRAGFRKMVGNSLERTLVGALLPPKTSHTNGVISVCFNSLSDTVELSALTSSIVLDYYIKATGTANLTSSRILPLPLGIEPRIKSRLIIRSLLLNCINKYYAPLWECLFQPSFLEDSWSIEDKRIKPFSKLTSSWSIYTPLRNYFERRVAAIEIDVLTAMGLNLSFENLLSLYILQFPVLEQNESDTWYDRMGNIVFTCSAGLKGVGLERRQWEYIRGELCDDGMTYIGTSETYTHTIDPAKSELYGGQQVTYYAPYTKCDRIEDYRRAWAHFEKVFNEKK